MVNAGVSMEDIEAHGRWQSDAFKIYIQAAPAVRMVVMASM